MASGGHSKGPPIEEGPVQLPQVWVTELQPAPSGQSWGPRHW